LAIAYRLVKQHNGMIRAYDAPGGGSIFEIELPLEQERAKSSPAPALSTVQPPIRPSAI
jgi:K+-sensing histidine kinase KdpD